MFDRTWQWKTDAELDDIVMRFHYELVRIHPWPNGNGRHARLAADVLLEAWGRPPFTWGSAGDLVAPGEVRAAYIAALRRADGGDFTPLRAFVRS
jgi:Fic family protein